MDGTYHDAMRAVADAYGREIRLHGGRSLARVGTIVADSGSFFDRLASGKTFTVATLEKFAAWFREPSNWPDAAIPSPAAVALTSMGRPPLFPSVPLIPQQCADVAEAVDGDRRLVSPERRS